MSLRLPKQTAYERIILLLKKTSGGGGAVKKHVGGYGWIITPQEHRYVCLVAKRDRNDTLLYNPRALPTLAVVGNLREPFLGD